MTITPTASPELLDLDKLEALAHAATPGPWGLAKITDRSIEHLCPVDRDRLSLLTVVHEGETPYGAVYRDEDANFVAAIHPEQVLTLIALARRARPYATGGAVPGGLHLVGEAPQATCTVPPEGWHCTRAPGHDGPCAAWPTAQQAAAPGALEKSARALAEKWHKDAVDTGFATSEAAVELLEVLDAAPSAPGTPEAPITSYEVRNPRTGKSRYVSKSKKHLAEHWTQSGYEVYGLVRAAQLDGGQGEKA